MRSTSDSSYYHWEFFVAGLAVLLESFMSVRYGPAVEYWWLGVATAAGTALLFAGADRSRYGELLLYAVGGVVGVAIVAGVPTLIDGSRMFMFGVWIGLGLNRFAFGFLLPIPEYRRSEMNRHAESG